jgi:hypothetical protein
MPDNVAATTVALTVSATGLVKIRITDRRALIIHNSNINGYSCWVFAGSVAVCRY